MTPNEVKAWIGVLFMSTEGYEEELKRLRDDRGRAQDLRNDLINDLNRIRNALDMRGARVGDMIEEVKRLKQLEGTK